MSKILRMNFTILHQVEVSDDITDEECEAIVQEFAEEVDIDHLYGDVEWEVNDA